MLKLAASSAFPNSGLVHLKFHDEGTRPIKLSLKCPALRTFAKLSTATPVSSPMTSFKALATSKFVLNLPSLRLSTTMITFRSQPYRQGPPDLLNIIRALYFFKDYLIINHHALLGFSKTCANNASNSYPINSENSSSSSSRYSGSSLPQTTNIDTSYATLRVLSSTSKCASNSLSPTSTAATSPMDSDSIKHGINFRSIPSKLILIHYLASIFHEMFSRRSSSPASMVRGGYDDPDFD
jgi:hypothetical protein